MSQGAWGTTLTSQYESILNDYGLDFSIASEHAEGAEAGINGCDTYLPERDDDYSGEQIDSSIKAAANDWTGELDTLSGGGARQKFVAFPGCQWSPEARCWRLNLVDLYPRDSNAGNETHGHINYIFSVRNDSAVTAGSEQRCLPRSACVCSWCASKARCGADRCPWDPARHTFRVKSTLQRTNIEVGMICRRSARTVDSRGKPMSPGDTQVFVRVLWVCSDELSIHSAKARMTKLLRRCH